VGDACESAAADEVAFLKAEKLVSYSYLGITGADTVTTSEVFVFCLYFDSADIETPEGTVSAGFFVQTEEFGDCSITTSSPAGDMYPPLVLDPGSPGVAANGTVSVDLLPSASSPGFYTSDYASYPDLLALGFDAGQTITYNFPGGADINAFTGSTEVPADVQLISPDFTDPNLTLDRNSALNVVWTAGNPSDTVEVALRASTQEPTSFVFVSCKCADTGSTTVSADLMSRLPADSASISLTVSRIREVELSLPLKVGSGTAMLKGMASVDRTWLFLGN